MAPRYGHGAWWPLAAWGASFAGLLLYIVRGVWLADAGPRVVLDLAWAPIYMVWKVVLALRTPRAKNPEWVRTAREGEKP